MNEISNTIKKFTDVVKTFVKAHFKLIIIIFLIIVVIAAATYRVMKWTSEKVAKSAREFTSNVNIDSNGSFSTDITVTDLWNKMIKEGYEVDKYLDSPKELLKLLQAELVTKLPDTRNNVETPINWDLVLNPVAKEKQETDIATVKGEDVQGIIKFLRHDENGKQHYLTYASPNEFNSWINEYKSTGSDSAKEKALSHYTLKKTVTGKNSVQRASSGIEAVIAAAESQLGVVYSYEGSYAVPRGQPGEGFNCSGLVWWAFEQGGFEVDHAQCAYGADPPYRGMIDTVKQKCGDLIKDQNQLSRGDVLFYNTGDGRESGHVALYLGNGERIHANGDSVVKDSNAFNSSFIGGGPLVYDESAKTTSNTSTNNTNTKTNKTTNSNSSYSGQSESVSGGDGYDEIYTSSNGFTYKAYKQYTGSYAGKSWFGGTITDSGCGPTSLAIIASGLRQDLDYTPAQVVDMLENGGYYEPSAGAMAWAMNKLGFNAEYTDFNDNLAVNPPTENVERIKNEIKSGKVLMLEVEYQGEEISTKFTSGPGHFVTAVDINSNGQIYVINPNSKPATTGWYDAEDVTRGCYRMYTMDTGRAITTEQNTDSSGILGYQAIIATWSQVDKSTELNNSPHAEEACENLGISIENGTTYTMTTKTIDYESMVQPYTLNFDLLWTFLVLGQTKGFVMDWADLAYNSEIIVSVYDNLTTTTDIDNWHYTEETDVKVSGYVVHNFNGGSSRYRYVNHEHIYENGDTSVKKENGEITKKVVTNNNTVVAELTKAHTWIADYDVYYTYSNDGGNTQTGQQSRDNYTVVDWTKGSIEDDPCEEIDNKIQEVVNAVNDVYKEIADEQSEQYLKELDSTIGDTGGAVVNVVAPKTISAGDVDTSNVDVQTRVNHVDIVDNTTDITVIRKYTAGTPNFVIKDSETSGTVIGGSKGLGIVGDNLEEKVWWAVQNAGYSKEATAGVMGNIYAESGFQTNSLESGYSYETIMNDENLGLGLCGWTFQPWKEELINFAKSRGKDWTDEDIQVEFLISGITPGGVPGVSGYWMEDRNGCSVEAFKNASTPEDAAYQFCWIYENPGIPRMDVRQSKAREYYDKYKDYLEPATKKVESLDNFLFIGDSRYSNGGAINSAISSAGNNITIFGVGSSTIDQWLDIVNHGGSGMVRGETVNVTGNYSGISIQLGANSVLNNVDDAASKMRDLINKLKELNPNVPIFVNSCLGVNSNATSSGYEWDVTNMQNCINGFNNKVKEYCNTIDNTYYIDISSGLMDSSGFVKLGYESDGVHMDSSEGANIYVENLKNGIFGSNTSSRSTKKTSGENFVTLFNKPKYRQNKYNILSATEWLFEIMEENDKLANMVELMKYLLYKATGTNFGATDIEQIWEEYVNSFNSIDSSGGRSGIPGVEGQIYDFLLSKGVPPVGAAAVMGNIQNESGFQPGVVNKIGAAGLCQWYEGRFENLKKFAASKGTDWKDVNTQMEYLWKELSESYTGVKSVIMDAKSESDLEYATWYWGSHFEVYDLAASAGFETSKNWEEEKERYKDAQYWYEQWKTHHIGGGNIALGGIKTDAEAQELTQTFNKMLNTQIHSNGEYQSGPFEKWWRADYNPIGALGDGYPFQCTWWAWGRASMYLEQSGSRYSRYPTAWGDGGDYYDENIKGGWFNYGSTPKPNSIVSWSSGSYGHVAYVEGVSSDGIYISHAGSGSSWRGVEKIPLNGDYRGGYTLNGYIYLDEPR